MAIAMFAGLLWSGLVSPQEDRQPRGLAGVGLTEGQVAEAVRRGADSLIESYKAGKNYGVDSSVADDFLIFLALHHAGMLRTDADLDARMIRRLQGARNWLGVAVGTTNVSILAMLLGMIEIDRSMLADCAAFLVETQGPAGTWGGGVYQTPVPLVEGTKAKRAVITVTGGQGRGGEEAPWIELARRTSEFGKEGTTGHSFWATLGLAAAARGGVGIPKQVWSSAYDGVVGQYDRDRGRWQQPDGAFSCSTTVDATATLALCRTKLGGDPSKDEWVQKGLKWVHQNFRPPVQVPPNPVEPVTYFGSYLFALSRLGLILGVDFFGDHEWYPAIAKFLLECQKEDGSWYLNDARLSSTTDTAWAILFLTRAAEHRTLTVPKKPGGVGTLETQTVLPGLYFHVILDASGSMTKKIGEKTKFKIACDAVQALVAQLPDEAWIGLRVYGNRFNATEAEADTDSNLEIPIGRIDRKRFHSVIGGLKCRGKTPLTYSLRESVSDVSAVPAGAEVRVILLTDGIESTRGAKPAQAAAELLRSRSGVRLIVVGFDVLDLKEQSQLRSIAESGKGLFIAAVDAGALAGDLFRAMKGAGDYVLLDGRGKEIAKGTFGDRRSLAEGKYLLVFDYRGKEVRQELWVDTNGVTRVVVDLFAEETP